MSDLAHYARYPSGRRSSIGIEASALAGAFCFGAAMFGGNDREDSPFYPKRKHGLGPAQ